VVILSEESTGKYLKMRVMRSLPEHQLADYSSATLQTFNSLLEILKKQLLCSSGGRGLVFEGQCCEFDSLQQQFFAKFEHYQFLLKIIICNLICFLIFFACFSLL
jgi:hypothetical protein